MNARPFIAATTAFVGTLLAAIAYLASNNWFGVSDLGGLAVWTLPLALMIYGASSVLDTKKTSWRFVAAGLLGPLLGFGVYAMAAAILGAWMGAFSFPVLFCWVFGGALGLTVAAWMPQPRTWPLALVLASVAALGLLRGNAYARTPGPRIALYLTSSATDADVERVWEEVIGRPSTTGQCFDLLDGIQGAGISGYAGGQPIFTVNMSKGLSAGQRDSLIAVIRKSPLIDRVVLLSPSDNSGVRTSVSY